MERDERVRDKGVREGILHQISTKTPKCTHSKGNRHSLSIILKGSEMKTELQKLQLNTTGYTWAERVYCPTL